MSRLDDIIYSIGSPWGEGATYDRGRISSMKEEGLDPSSHMSKEEEIAMKRDIKALMLKLIGGDEEQLWDDEYNMCNRCEFELIDDTKNCICVQRNKLRAELRKKVEEL